MAKKTDIVKNVPKWAMVPSRVDLVVQLAATGMGSRLIAREVGYDQHTVLRLLRRKDVQKRIVEHQDAMRAQLTGKSVNVARNALGVLNKALRDESITLLQRARLAVRVLEAQSKAQAVAQQAPIMQTSVSITAGGLLERLKNSRPSELSDDELQLVCEAPNIIEGELAELDDFGSAEHTERTPASERE